MANPKGRPKSDPLTRFMKYVRVDEQTGCWIWTGSLNVDGYGRFMYEGECIAAHRAAYLIQVGSIPEGMQLDHTCHDPLKCARGNQCPHRRCVNLDHLELVTLVDNLERAQITEARLMKTHCPRGHPYPPRPSYLPTRRCMICAAAWKRRARAIKRR